MKLFVRGFIEVCMSLADRRFIRVKLSISRVMLHASICDSVEEVQRTITAQQLFRFNEYAEINALKKIINK
jgi:hypothetical protein